MKNVLRLEIQSRLDQLCKPPGSLGGLEALAARLAEVQNTLHPETSPRRVVIFAADHGVTCEGVSAWPSEVTGMVTSVMRHQRTASGVFAKRLSCEYEVVDVGLLNPLESFNNERHFINAARRRGTANLRIETAMTPNDFDHAWSVGVDRANAAADAGCRIVIGGEMGIGNTTSASCIVSLMTNIESSSIDSIVGRGAGVDDRGLEKKIAVITNATNRVRALKNVDAKRIACEVGGLEIVALSGFYTQSAQRGMTILLDGFIATSAALLAQAMMPQVTDNMIAGHQSTEPGHQRSLAKLNLSPVLDLGLRLGEGTGALAALPLLDLAATMMNEMATLEELKP